MKLSRVSVVAFAFLAACGSKSSSGGFGGGSSDQNQTATDAGSSPTGGGSLGAGSDADGGSTTPANCSDPNAQDLAGCSCTGDSRACFTGDPKLRGQAGCQDGTQTCAKSGEFSTWSACTSDVTTCTPGPSDAGTAACTGQCKPGATRYCDTPEACSWGKQQCMPDGTWGGCVETQDRPPGCTSGFAFDNSYDEDCCVQAGACCQDIDGDDETKSRGQCDQIACPDNVVK